MRRSVGFRRIASTERAIVKEAIVEARNVKSIRGVKLDLPQRLEAVSKLSSQQFGFFREHLKPADFLMSDCYRSIKIGF